MKVLKEATEPRKQNFDQQQFQAKEFEFLEFLEEVTRVPQDQVCLLLGVFFLEELLFLQVQRHSDPSPEPGMSVPLQPVKKRPRDEIRMFCVFFF